MPAYTTLFRSCRPVGSAVPVGGRVGRVDGGQFADLGEGVGQGLDRCADPVGQFPGVGRPDHRAGLPAVLVVGERTAGQVHPLVEHHPRHPAGLGQHQSGELGVAGALVAEPFPGGVDQDSAVHHPGPGHQRAVAHRDRTVPLVGVQTGGVRTQVDTDPQRVPGAAGTTVVEPVGDLRQVPTDQFGVRAETVAGQHHRPGGDGLLAGRPGQGGPQATGRFVRANRGDRAQPGRDQQVHATFGGGPQQLGVQGASGPVGHRVAARVGVAGVVEVGDQGQFHPAVVGQPGDQVGGEPGQCPGYHRVGTAVGLAHDVGEEHLGAVGHALLALPATATGRNHGRAHRGVALLPERRACLDQQHGQATSGRGQCRGEPGGAGSRHQHVDVDGPGHGSPPSFRRCSACPPRPDPRPGYQRGPVWPFPRVVRRGIPSRNPPPGVSRHSPEAVPRQPGCCPTWSP